MHAISKYVRIHSKDHNGSLSHLIKLHLKAILMLHQRQYFLSIMGGQHKVCSTDECNKSLQTLCNYVNKDLHATNEDGC